MKIFNDTKTMVSIAMLASIQIMLAITPLGFIPLGAIRPTTIHIPVIIGAVLFGAKAGAILGGIFGISSIIINTVTPTITSFVFTPFYGGNIFSLVVAMVPRIMIGVVSYYVFILMVKVTNKKSISYIIAGVMGSMTNTILVMSGIYIFFGDNYATAKSIPIDELFVFIIGIIGINGIPEAIVAGVITLAIGSVLNRILKIN